MDMQTDDPSGFPRFRENIQETGEEDPRLFVYDVPKLQCNGRYIRVITWVGDKKSTIIIPEQLQQRLGNFP